MERSWNFLKLNRHIVLPVQHCTGSAILMEGTGNMDKEKVISYINEERVIVIVRKIYGEDCKKLTEALYKGGIKIIEFTFDQESKEDWDRTVENIKWVSEQYQDKMICGAGTVLSEIQVQKAANAGAKLIIAPDVNKKVIEKANKHGLVSIPGAMTSTEILQAYNYGADFVKVFPAEELGSGYIKAIRGPINHVPLMAVGGIRKENIREYLKAGVNGVGIGGKLVQKDLIKSGKFDEIEKIAKEIIQEVKRA